jgi:YD repeat-containing protein
VYEYIQDRGLQKITDPHGNTVTFTKTAITHSDGEQVQLIRDARGRITQIIDTAGQTLSYQYDAARNLVGFTNQIGDTTRYVYRDTPAHFLDEIYDSLNVRIFKAEFDDDGRLTGATDALGNVVQQEFDPGAFSGTITDARGNVTTIWYDQRGNVTQEQSAPVLNPITGDRSRTRRPTSTPIRGTRTRRRRSSSTTGRSSSTNTTRRATRSRPPGPARTARKRSAPASPTTRRTT